MSKKRHGNSMNAKVNIFIESTVIIASHFIHFDFLWPISKTMVSSVVNATGLLC